MLCPLRASQPGAQGVFKLPVHPLHHPVGLWMVSGIELALHTQLLAEAGPERGDELAALVRGEERRHAKTRDPCGGEGMRACGCLDVPEWDGFQPARGTVDHGEEISVPLWSCGERPDQVNVHVGEAMAWHMNGLHGGGGLFGDLHACTVLAVPAPCDHVLVHLLPDYPGGEEPPGGTDTGMDELVKGVEDCPAVLEGN